MPDDERNKPSTKTTLVATAHIGPLPTPEDLAAYEKVSPGLAKLIADMAQKEQDHRHECEKKFTPIFLLDRLSGKLITAVTIIGIALIATLASPGSLGLSYLLAGLLGIPTLVDLVKMLRERFSDNTEDH